MTDRGLFTPETVRRYLMVPPDGFPAVTFYSADVAAGDAIWRPMGLGAPGAEHR
jgi:hypothetical protein